MTLTLGSLCTGAGGLDLAATAVLGDVHTAWVAENDPDASTVLAARFPKVPNLGDIAAADFGEVESVDVIVAGFPCQDISNAGKRAGLDGEKSGVWRHVARAVGVVRPRLVLVENVAALLVRGGVRVVADLAALGYVGSWLSLRASDVGAPHQRNRVFLAAADALSSIVTLLPTPRGSEGAKGGPKQRGSAGDLTLTSSVMQLLPTPTATDSHGHGHNNRGEPYLPGAVADVTRWGQYAAAVARWEKVLGRPAPEPTVVGGRGGKRPSARFVEWMLGWPKGWVTDLVDNTPALKLIGNGVCVQQGAEAFRRLGVRS